MVGVPTDTDDEPDRWREQVVELLEGRRRIEEAKFERRDDDLVVAATIDSGRTLLVPVDADDAPRDVARFVRGRLNYHFE